MLADLALSIARRGQSCDHAASRAVRSSDVWVSRQSCRACVRHGRSAAVLQGVELKGHVCSI